MYWAQMYKKKIYEKLEDTQKVKISTNAAVSPTTYAP